MLTVTQAFCESRAAQLRFQAQTGYMYMKFVGRKMKEKEFFWFYFSDFSIVCYDHVGRGQASSNQGKSLAPLALDSPVLERFFGLMVSRQH